MPGGFYYRIQRAGQGLEDAPLQVFLTPIDLIFCEGNPTKYGNEVVEISSPRHWDDRNSEYVRINPTYSRITNRWKLDDFAKHFFPKHTAKDEYTYEEEGFRDLPHWATVRVEGEVPPDCDEPSVEPWE